MRSTDLATDRMRSIRGCRAMPCLRQIRPRLTSHANHRACYGPDAKHPGVQGYALPGVQGCALPGVQGCALPGVQGCALPGVQGCALPLPRLCHAQ